jgi:hypothetical protein
MISTHPVPLSIVKLTLTMPSLPPSLPSLTPSLPPSLADVGCGDGKYMQLKQYDFHPSAFSLGCDRSLRLLHCTQGGREGGKEGGGEEGVVEESLEVFACDVLKVREGGGREGGREGEMEGKMKEGMGLGREGGGREGRRAWMHLLTPLLIFMILFLL